MAGAEHAAPGVAQQVVVILDAEVGEEVVELVQEQLLGPEGGVAHFLGEMGGAAGAELVVEDYGDVV